MYHLLNIPRITKAGDRFNVTVGRKNIRNVATLQEARKCLSDYNQGKDIRKNAEWKPNSYRIVKGGFNKNNKRNWRLLSPDNSIVKSSINYKELDKLRIKLEKGEIKNV